MGKSQTGTEYLAFKFFSDKIASVMKFIRYPKFILLFLIIMSTIILFGNKNINMFDSYLSSLGYLGTFIAGIFYSYGFTAAPATAVLLVLSKTQILFFAAVLGGIGSLFTDLIIFRFIRSSFSDEISKLSKERIILWIDKAVLKWKWLRNSILLIIGAAIIASPLPDEIGVSLFAISRQVPEKWFVIISFLLNTIGIFVVLLIGSSL